MARSPFKHYHNLHIPLYASEDLAFQMSIDALFQLGCFY